MMTPGDRLKKAREDSGFTTAKDAALSMGVPIATYTQHEKAEKFLPARRAAQYASFFRTTPEFLLYGRADAVPERVPVMDQEGAETGAVAVLPPAPSELTRAMLTTEGDGIGHLGFVALYDEPQVLSPNPDIYGRLCVVALPPGSGKTGSLVHVVRIVQEGSAAGCFHLIGGRLPLLDQRIVWAAPVIALVPA